MRGRGERHLLLVLAGLAYASWLAEFVLPTGLSARHGYVSELAADGRPWAWFFRCGDLVAGLSVVAWAVLELVQARGLRRSQLRTRGFLLAFGLATLADALVPMACAPSLDAGCEARAAEAGGALPHLLHTASSSVAGTAMLLVVWGTVWTAWTRRNRPISGRGSRAAGGRSALGPVWLVLALGYTLATLWTMVEVARIELLGEPASHLALGLAQRVELAVASAWLVGQGWALHRRRTH